MYLPQHLLYTSYVDRVCTCIISQSETLQINNQTQAQEFTVEQVKKLVKVMFRYFISFVVLYY